VREAGQRIARLMAELDASDSAALQVTISEMFAALRGLTPPERVSAVDYAEAVEREVAQ
jgi:hypothetical protein